MRLNFEFNDALVESLNALKEKTGAATMKELFNNAFTMLEWAVDETEQGKEIVATDGRSSRVFVTPLLRQVKSGGMTGKAIMEAVDTAVREGRAVAVPFKPEDRRVDARGDSVVIGADELDDRPVARAADRVANEGQDVARDRARGNNPNKAAH